MWIGVLAGAFQTKEMRRVWDVIREYMKCTSSL